MFCKRLKKEIAPGTFISTPARLMAILQLCLAFTVLAWQAGYPFMGELFEIKSKLLVYDYVMGVNNATYAEQFSNLPEKKKEEILREYQTLKAHLGRPFVDKALDSVERVFFSLSPFKLLWIFFSIIIPILLLKKVEGAASVIWLLPLTTMVFIVHNRWYGEVVPLSKDTQLFPTEEIIVNNYLRHPLSSDLNLQEKQLRNGWELYLIEEWAKETPSSDAFQFTLQKEKGDFAFNLARLSGLEIKPYKSFNNTQESYPVLALYLFWNLSFALVVGSALQTPQTRQTIQIVYHSSPLSQ